MIKKNTIPIRADNKFTRELIKDVQLQRIKLGKDPPLKPIKTSRITLAMARHPLAKQMKKDIILADLK